MTTAAAGGMRRPAPTIRLATLNALQEPDRTRYFLAASYHTVYVMGLLFTTELAAAKPRQHHQAPTWTTPAGRLDQHIAGPPRHWHRTYRRLGPDARRRVLPVGVNVAVKRALDSHDLRTVDKLTRLEPSPHYRALPAITQARLALDRLITIPEIKSATS
jgi:hypothetical protein